MKEFLRSVRASRIGRMLNIPVRAYWALPRASKPLIQMMSWLFASREDTNLTFPITERNKNHLAHAVSAVTGAPWADILGYIREIEEDEALRRHVIQSTLQGPDRPYADARADYGRRIGWYATARVLRPEVVVETGVDKGLGAVVLCAALLRNGKGRYYGTDKNPLAGRLLSGRYAEVGEILYGDSIESLKGINEAIDLFINDSDHSASYERAEYDVIAPKLSERAIVLSDNAHFADSAMEWSRIAGRRFLFWREQSDGHWYPGDGIGFSYPG